MRFLIDECVSRRIVRRLLAEGHDVAWIAEDHPGEADDDVLRRAWCNSRILLTEDWDFGELAIRFKKPAFGTATIAASPFAADLDGIAASLVRRLTDLDDGLVGKLTIIEDGRVRQRDLVHANQR